MNARVPTPARSCAAAFTLLEVVLALSIAIGLLSVVLYFYQQMARLRDQTLTDAAQLSAIRLFMDRLANELRTAVPRPGGFRGDSQSLEFLRTTLIPPGRARTDTNHVTLVPGPSPLRRIRYQVAGTNPTGAVTGVARLDEPAAPSPDDFLEASLFSDDLSSTNLGDLGSIQFLAEPIQPAAETTPPVRGLLIPEIRYLTLRYWNGATWLESWTDEFLPRGVEISLAADALPPTASSGTFPRELFRRIVALPAANPEADSDWEEDPVFETPASPDSTSTPESPGP